MTRDDVKKLSAEETARLRDAISDIDIIELAESTAFGLTHSDDYHDSRKARRYVCPKCDKGHKTGIWLIEDSNRLYCRHNNEVFDPIALIQAVKKCSYPEALAHGADYLNWTPGEPSTYRRKKPSTASPQSAKPDKPAPNYSEYLKSPRTEIKDDSPGAAYLRQRGLDLDTAKSLGIRFDPKHKEKDNNGGWVHSPRIIIPTGNGGYVGRYAGSSIPDNVDRVRFAHGYTVAPSFLEQLDSGDPVHVVEGWADALAIICAGGHAVSLNGAGQYGKLVDLLTIRQEQGIAIPPLILQLDPDDAGREKQAKFRTWLDARGIRYIDGNGNICLPDPDNPTVMLDPADSHLLDAPLFHARITADIEMAQGAGTPQDDANGSDRPNAERRGDACIFEVEGAESYLQSQFPAEVADFARYADRRTGFANLDARGPFWPGLYCIGAISSLGKTTWCLQLGDYLASQGATVLYFSIEQSRRTMYSKSIARTLYGIAGGQAPSAKDIATGVSGQLIDDGKRAYCDAVGDRMKIIQCGSRIRAMDVDATVRAYTDQTGDAPIAIIDYIQRLRPDDPRMSERESIENAVSVLQDLTLDLHATIIAVSSLNRAAYLQPMSFESFRGSGGLEFTADVAFGLELGCMSAPIFCDEKDVVKKRAIMARAKTEMPREIRLQCLKNRDGITSYDALFYYYPEHDYFEALTDDDARVVHTDMGIDFKAPRDRQTWRTMTDTRRTESSMPSLPIDNAIPTGEYVTLSKERVKKWSVGQAHEILIGLTDPSDRGKVKSMLPSDARATLLRKLKDGPVQFALFSDTPAIPA